MRPETTIPRHRHGTHGRWHANCRAALRAVVSWAFFGTAPSSPGASTAWKVLRFVETVIRPASRMVNSTAAAGWPVHLCPTCRPDLQVTGLPWRLVSPDYPPPATLEWLLCSPPECG